MSILILYGTETGNSESLAYKLYDITLNKGYNCRIMGMDDYSVRDLPNEKLVLMIVATSGDGEAPPNMLKFWKFLLQRSLSSSSLINVNIGVFGLGDSSYERFNAAARRLNTRCKQLGAKPLLGLGLGDHQAGYSYYTAWNEWLEKLWLIMDSDERNKEFKSLLFHQNRCNNGDTESKKYNKKKKKNENQCHSSKLYTITTISKDDIDTEENLVSFYEAMAPIHALNINGRSSNSGSSGGIAIPVDAVLKENLRMTSKDWRQDVRHLRFTLPCLAPLNSSTTSIDSIDSSKRSSSILERDDTSIFHQMEQVSIKNEDLSKECDRELWRAGDVAVILPHNEPDLVSRALALVTKIHETDSDTTSITNIDSRSLFRFEAPSFDKTQPPRRSRLGVAICNLHTLFSRTLDISAVPLRSFFEELSVYAKNPEEKNKLLELSSAEGTDLYFDYCVKERRSYIECMEEFPSARPPLVALLYMIPLIRPRQFSIASSTHLANPNPTHLDNPNNNTSNSNSNSNSFDSDMYLDLCVGLVETLTPYRRRRLGVCSSFLCNMQPSSPTTNTPITTTTTTAATTTANTASSRVSLWIRKGDFRLNANNDLSDNITTSNSTSHASNANASDASGDDLTPLVLIGPGTGVAPMRALILERIRSLRRINTTTTTTTTSDLPLSLLLFYGCRKRNEDFLYQKEWLSDETCGGLGFKKIIDKEGELLLQKIINKHRIEIHCAFSRDIPLYNQTPDKGGRMYVTKLIKSRADDIQSMLLPSGGDCSDNKNKNKVGRVFVAGSAKRMPSDVRRAIKDALCRTSSRKNSWMSIREEEEVEKLLAFMTKHKNYYVEAWS